jgi:hypothetical protein
MDSVSMQITEGKGYMGYTFSYCYVTKNQDLEWVKDVVEARRSGDKWAFNFNKVENQTIEQLNTYATMLQKVNQVVETNATNLSGIKVTRAQVGVKVDA